MDDSTNTLLYTATYVIIFIIAVSLSIVLFLSVNRYADSAFEYTQGLNGSIINTGTTGTETIKTGNVPLTKDDVFSYYVNYVKKDLYGEVTNTNQDVIYNVDIKDKNGISLNNEMSYTQVYNSLSDKYVLRYVGESVDTPKKVNINIEPIY